jgi:hypothetical protein
LIFHWASVAKNGVDCQLDLLTHPTCLSTATPLQRLLFLAKLFLSCASLNLSTGVVDPVPPVGAAIWSFIAAL